MSKELKIVGALGKDYQQIYIDGDPTGIEINGEGKVRIKDLVVDKTIFANNETLKLMRGSDYYSSATIDNKTSAIQTDGDLIVDTGGNFYLENDGGVFYIKKSALSKSVFEIISTLHLFPKSELETNCPSSGFI